MWFQERLYLGYAQQLSVGRTLCHAQTRFQDVVIFENPLFGKVMVLDGVVQLTERDNHIYHEMIAHVPLLAHGSARRVLIIGGGDGGTLREVLRHPVERVCMVELDGEVVDLARKHLPEVSAGAFDDPRTELIIGDGCAYVADSGEQFDAIIIDSTDPVGPGEVLFSEQFYANCKRRLAPGGVLTAQSGAPFFQPGELAAVRARLSASFSSTAAYLAPVPTYAGGMLALVGATDREDGLLPAGAALEERFAPLDGQTAYYSPAVHRAAFVLPPTFGGHRPAASAN